MLEIDFPWGKVVSWGGWGCAPPREWQDVQFAQFRALEDESDLINGVIVDRFTDGRFRVSKWRSDP